MFDIDVVFGLEKGYYGGDGEVVTIIIVYSLT
jgi:hypothetical protein